MSSTRRSLFETSSRSSLLTEGTNVRSQSTATPSPDRHHLRHPGPRIVSIDANSTTLSDFASELPAKETPTVQPATRQFSWRKIALGLLAVAVAAQAGFITYWLTMGRAAPAPDSGSVSVTSEPLGSPVAVDGVSRGTTPFVVSLPPGPHRIDVGTGLQVRTQTVSVTRGGEASLHIELRRVLEPGGVRLAPGTGGLQVATEPAGAQVWIDNEPRGAAPLSVSDLKAGEHVVVVKGSGDAVNRTVTIQEGAVASLIISMNSRSAFASGWLSISSSVPLQITENGTLLGSTETPRILLPAGSHDLELANAAVGYRVSRTVHVAAGQTTSIPMKLPQGTLSVNALPWAEVWVDGRPAGETPIGNLSLTIGNHEVLFRHPELGEQRKIVAVGALAPVRVGVDLRK